MPPLAYHPGMHANLSAMPLDLDARQARFATLLQLHHGLLRKIAWGFSHCAADRADLMQDMATQLWAVFAQWDEERPFSTWAWRVGLNVALSQQRRTRDVPRSMLDLHDSENEHLHPESPEPGPEQNAQLRDLHRVVAALDPLNRALLLLYLDDVSYRDIGEVLGLSESNVGVRLNRLKSRLRQQLEPNT